MVMYQHNIKGILEQQCHIMSYNYKGAAHTHSNQEIGMALTARAPMHAREVDF